MFSVWAFFFLDKGRKIRGEEIRRSCELHEELDVLTYDDLILSSVIHQTLRKSKWPIRVVPNGNV